MAEVLDQFKKILNLSPEVQDKFISIMEKYGELDDEEKAEFHETVKESLQKTFAKHKFDFIMGKFWGYTTSYTALFLAVILILLIFVFFGYKLYKSLVERERKREEKRKVRELKKKK